MCRVSLQIMIRILQVGTTQGIINGFILTPVDTVRARLMVQVSTQCTASDCITFGIRFSLLEVIWRSLVALPLKFSITQCTAPDGITFSIKFLLLEVIWRSLVALPLSRDSQSHSAPLLIECPMVPAFGI